MGQKNWVKAKETMSNLRKTLNDPKIPKLYCSMYNKEFYEQVVNK